MQQIPQWVCADGSLRFPRRFRCRYENTRKALLERWADCSEDELPREVERVAQSGRGEFRTPGHLSVRGTVAKRGGTWQKKESVEEYRE